MTEHMITVLSESGVVEAVTAFIIGYVIVVTIVTLIDNSTN